MFRTQLCVFTVLLALAGCSNARGTPGGGTPQGTASQSEIADCRESCNQLKFFDCNDALDHATCFANCDVADSDAVALFTACVSADICDPQCSVHIQPRPSGPAPMTVSGDGCVDSCQAFVADGCVPGASGAECAQVCAEEPALANYCLGGRTGCDLPAGCNVQPPTPAEECMEGCQTLGFFNCITATDASDCVTLCGSSDAATVDRFSACAASGLCEDDSCYRILNTSGGSADVAGCRSACDQMGFFDCLDAATLSECRNHCADASADAVNNFKACAMGTCDDDSCWTVFRDS